MVKISQLQYFYQRFQQKGMGTSISDFINFIENEQKTNKKGGVVPLEERITHQNLRTLEEQQAANKQIDPEYDLANL